MVFKIYGCTFTPWNCAASVPCTREAATSKTFLLFLELFAQISLCFEILSGAKLRLQIKHWAKPAFGANFGFSLDKDLFIDWPLGSFVCFLFGDRVRLFWAWRLPFILLRNLSPIDAFETGVSFLGCVWEVVLAWDWNISNVWKNVSVFVNHRPIWHQYSCLTSIENSKADLFIDRGLTLCSSHLPPSLLWIFLFSSALVASI